MCYRKDTVFKMENVLGWSKQSVVRHAGAKVKNRQFGCEGVWRTKLNEQRPG